MRGLPERSILAANLRALMDRPGKEMKEAEIEARTHRRVSQSSVNRILNQKVNCRLDHLAALAECFELAAWQMLVPGLQPDDPPVLTLVSKKLDEYNDKLKKLADDLAAMKKGKVVGGD